MVRSESHAMGSRLTLALAGAVRDGAADAASAAVRDEFAETERALSRFRSDSELSVLNARAADPEWHAVGERLWTCLVVSRRAHRITEGRFDPRVIAVLEAIGERAGVSLPSVVKAHGDKMFVELDLRRRRVRLWHPIDSGGIGKGLALRWSAARLRREWPDAAFLLEAGGDLVVHGRPPHAGAWHIAIEDPQGAPDPVVVLGVKRGAVVTSSIAVRHWLDGAGRPVHHLIDPHTGTPADSGLASVTVAAPDPAWAEVWSKALFLAGTRNIGPEARARGLAAWWVDVAGGLGMTPTARAFTTWSRGTKL
jgi:thiamine biosynthesis lipoprotein